MGGVLIPGAVAPKLIRKDDLKTMRQGSVIVDVAIDENPAAWRRFTRRKRTKSTHVVDGVIHYGQRTCRAAFAHFDARSASTQPSYALTLANKGWKEGAADRPPC